MKGPILILFSLIFMAGCQKPSGKWEAQKDVAVFKDANEADKLKYTIKKGEVCALGREQVVKVFMYREVSCDKGDGWLVYKGGYPFEKID